MHMQPNIQYSVPSLLIFVYNKKNWMSAKPVSGSELCEREKPVLRPVQSVHENENETHVLFRFNVSEQIGPVFFFNENEMEFQFRAHETGTSVS